MFEILINIKCQSNYLEICQIVNMLFRTIPVPSPTPRALSKSPGRLTLTPVALDHLRENLKRKAEHLSSPMSAKRSRKSSSDEAIDLSFKTTDSNSETSVEEIPNAPLPTSLPKDTCLPKGK